jgi:hypothetical protein
LTLRNGVLKPPRTGNEEVALEVGNGQMCRVGEALVAVNGAVKAILVRRRV